MFLYKSFILVSYFVSTFQLAADQKMLFGIISVMKAELKPGHTIKPNANTVLTCTNVQE